MTTNQACARALVALATLLVGLTALPSATTAASNAQRHTFPDPVGDSRARARTSTWSGSGTTC